MAEEDKKQTIVVDTEEKLLEIFGNPNFVSKAMVEALSQPQGLYIVRVDKV